MSDQIRQFTARQVGEAFGFDDAAITDAERILANDAGRQAFRKAIARDMEVGERLERATAGELVLRVDGLPLPPYALSKNGRDGWRTKNRTYGKHREDGRRMVWSAMVAFPATAAYQGPLDMVIYWRAPESDWPDDDNAIARCAAYRDGAADAGLVQNDADIRTAGVVYTSSSRKDAEVSLAFYLPIEHAAAESAEQPQPERLIQPWERELAAYIAIWRITLSAAIAVTPVKVDSGANPYGALLRLERELSGLERELGYDF